MTNTNKIQPQTKNNRKQRTMLNEGQPITKDNLKQRTTSNKGQPQTNDNVKQRATSNKGQHQTKNNLKYKIPSDRIHSHMEDNFALNRRLRQKEAKLYDIHKSNDYELACKSQILAILSRYIYFQKQLGIQSEHR